jgi:hypothetical protein
MRRAPARRATSGPQAWSARLRAGCSSALAAACAFALAAGCALLPPRALPPALLADLEARAERARGLRFESAVAADFVHPRRVRTLLAEELDAGLAREDFARAEAVAGAVGLLPDGIDLRATILELQTGAIAGFYTPLRRRLYVVHDGWVRRSLPPELAAVAVHELVHALQAAHTPLREVLLGLDDPDDLAFAIGALLEGDALLAALRDREAGEGLAPPSAAELASGFRLDEAPGAGLPRFLRESFLLQYPLGYAIAQASAQRGGPEALDAALRDPPLSSEELLHSERYLESRTPLAFLELAPASVGAGPACRFVGANTFGELGLRAWAAERGAPEERAAIAADGWDGDRAVVLDCGGRPAFAWLVQLDSEGDAVEVASVAAAGAPGDLSPSVEREGRRVLLARGLAPPARRAALAAPEQRFARLDAYLAARPEVLARARAVRARIRSAFARRGVGP